MTTDQKQILDYIFMRIGEIETPEENSYHLSLIADTIIIKNASEWCSDDAHEYSKTANNK